jgi:hemerythrin-like metal-binding protein
MTRYWKPSFCSLDPEVDLDHQLLFKLLDRVATLRRESDVEDLNPLLDQLLEYTFAHFAREERVMVSVGYPRSAHHSEAHAAVRKALIESLRRVVKGSLTTLAFTRHLKESFTFHFESDDMTFVTWLHQNRSKDPDFSASAPKGRHSPPGEDLSSDRGSIRAHPS